MRRVSCAVVGVSAAVAVCLSTLGTTVAVAGKPAADIPVAVTFRNATLPADRVQSVGSPTYTNGEPGVVATLNGSTGRLLLNTCFPKKGGTTCASQGRYEVFDFTDAANAFFELPFSTPTTAPATLNAYVFEDDGATYLPRGFFDLMHAVGEIRLGGMLASFPVAGAGQYTLRFTPNMYPASNHVLVTYLGGSVPCTTAGACASWSVEAVNGSFGTYPELQDIGELVTQDNSVDYGQYHLPIKIVISVLTK